MIQTIETLEFHAMDTMDTTNDSWKINVLVPGYYNVDLTYSGTGRIVWSVDVEGGQHIENQQNSHNYQKFPIGWIHFPETDKYMVSISCLEGYMAEASLRAIHFTPVL